MKRKRIYTIEKLPYNEDLDQFAVPYTPEPFNKEETLFLKPFFSNVDKPVFVAQHLPEEVIGALSSRYSRSTQSLRRLFLKEYIEPILHPEQQRDWSQRSGAEKKEARKTRKLFLKVIDVWNRGGNIDEVVNIQRGRKFFDTWLAQYGDDSIAEMGGIHLCIEGLSMIVTKEIEDKRIGISPLEKSTRYVQYWEKRRDGEYQFVVPGEIKSTRYEKKYRQIMNTLFDTYAGLADPYLEYIKNRYPKGDDETDRSFENSRSAKRFDDIRELLPFSTQTNLALFGNGRAFEDIVNRCINHPLGEIRWWGRKICRELERVVPSFVARPKTLRGAEVQYYRGNIQNLREELVEVVLHHNARSSDARWVRLLSFTKDADIEVLSAFLFQAAEGVSLYDIRKQVKKMGFKKRKKLLAHVLNERKFNKTEVLRQEARFRKVPRAFENAHYLFELWGRGGDYRDLHRHRLLTQERQYFTTIWGYDLDKDVISSPFIEKINRVLLDADELHRELKKSPYVAQYAVPFGYLQHWYVNLTAREIYWIVELRTGPQGRPHYRQICQDIAKNAIKATPLLFQSLMTDWNDYSLARRESEKKIDKKLNELSKNKS